MGIYVDTPNPLAPQTSPDATALTNAYQAHASALRGEANTAQSHADYNPYAAVEDNQSDAQQQHISAMEQALAPVPMNEYDVNNDHSEEDHQTFLTHIEHDPAFKEFGDDMIDKLEVLRQGVISGQIDMAAAREMAASYGNDVIKPIINKHHGKHSDTHMVGLFDKEHAAFLKGGK